jgi:hypothetical protein
MKQASRRNRIASLIAYVSGAMLIASGSTGVSSLQKVRDATLAIVNIPLIQRMFVLVLILASLGGLTVIIGGTLIKNNFVRTGKIFLWIGSGVGLVSLMVNLFTTASAEGLSLVVLFSLSSMGVLLAIVAQLVAKNSRY